MRLVAVVCAGYLLGAVPTGVLLARHLRGMDIRRHGSGNPGAANTLRVLGAWPAVFVLAVDGAKGWFAAWAGGAVSVPGTPVDPAWWPALAGGAAVLGHVWPVWTGFRGGKGVATAAGVALRLAPVSCGVALLVFAATVAAARRISVGSMAAATAFALVLVGSRLAGRDPGAPALAFAVWFALTVFWTHRSNLRNLAAGREPRLW